MVLLPLATSRLSLSVLVKEVGTDTMPSIGLKNSQVLSFSVKHLGNEFLSNKTMGPETGGD